MGDHGLNKIHYPNGVIEEFATAPSGKPTKAIATNTSSLLVELYYYYQEACGGSGAEQEVIGARVQNPSTWWTATYFCHDRYDRLTDAQSIDWASTVTERYQYTYDPVGNIKTAIVSGAYVTASTIYSAYDDQNRLCKTSTTSGPTCPTSSYPYNYDANGNQLTGGGHTPAYNPKDQTTTIDSVTSTYADVDQTQRTQAGSTTFNNWILGLDTETHPGGPSRSLPQDSYGSVDRHPIWHYAQLLPYRRREQHHRSHRQHRGPHRLVFI